MNSLSFAEASAGYRNKNYKNHEKSRESARWTRETIKVTITNIQMARFFYFTVHP